MSRWDECVLPLPMVRILFVYGKGIRVDVGPDFWLCVRGGRSFLCSGGVVHVRSAAPGTKDNDDDDEKGATERVSLHPCSRLERVISIGPGTVTRVHMACLAQRGAVKAGASRRGHVVLAGEPCAGANSLEFLAVLTSSGGRVDADGSGLAHWSIRHMDVQAQKASCVDVAESLCATDNLRVVARTESRVVVSGTSGVKYSTRWGDTARVTLRRVKQ